MLLAKLEHLDHPRAQGPREHRDNVLARNPVASGFALFGE